jgi:HlyD family secretion protein
MKRNKILIAAGVIVVLAAIVYANFHFKRTTGTSVTVEKIERRDLEAIVSASGTIQPKASVDISADTMGRVVNLAVNEGDMVKKGQFLLQIDPTNLQTQVHNQEASLAASKSSLEEMRNAVESARVALAQSQSTLTRQEGLFKAHLGTLQDYENAQNDFRMKQAALQQLEQGLKTQDLRIAQQQAILDSAQYDLTKVRIVAPLDGIVTRRNILEGETVVIGTMNNAGTVLLTVADMSVIQAEIEVDETDIPSVKIGQPGKIKIDAFPDKEFPGKVTEVGNSPIQATGAAATTRATNFKVKVTLDKAIPEARPGFTCSAVITTATRQQALAVPIQATTVREMIVDAKGQIVREAPPGPGQPRRPAPGTTPDLKPGQSRKEIEGVLVARDGHAVFVAVKSGIAGEKYFEVLDGLKEGDLVITGPFASVRTMKDGDAVVVPTPGAAGSSAAGKSS